MLAHATHVMTYMKPAPPVTRIFLGVYWQEGMIPFKLSGWSTCMADEAKTFRFGLFQKHDVMT